MMYGCLIFGRNLDQEKQNKTYKKEQNKKINNDENKKNPENPKSKLEPANHVETILSKIKGGNQTAGEILKLVNALNDGKCRHINSVQEISFSIVPKQDNEQPDKEQNKGGCIMF